jgi:arsenate reductase
MMSITIYHNPRCSKSRKTLELLQQSGITPEIIDYLDNAPTATATLRNAALLGVRVADLLRRNEAEFKEASDLPDLDDDAALAAWLQLHPRVIERPIVVDEANDTAVIGRPPENVLELLRK